MLLVVLFACAHDPCAGFVDADGDGYGTTPTDDCAAPTQGGDCADDDPAVHPGAPERCDTPGLDDDCDGLLDDADLDVVGATELHDDADGDGYGAASIVDVGCPAAGKVADATDCDDTDLHSHPGAVELCDGHDTDCDAATGEDGLVTWFAADESTTDLSGTFGGTAAAPTVQTFDDPGRLEVCAGTWYTRVELGSVVQMEAPAGAALTTLDAAGTGSVVAVQGATSDSEVRGFTLTGGEAESGGGIRCGGGATLAVYDSIITGNHATTGGGIASTACTVYLWYGELSANSAEEGGAAWVHDGHFEFNYIPATGNTASVAGGGLRVDAGATYTYTSISETIFSANDAPTGGAVALSGPAELQVYATVVDRGGILGNTSGSGGVLTTTGGALIEFVLADLGLPGTEYDNLPTDVTTPAGDSALDDDVTAWCDDGGCRFTP